MPDYDLKDVAPILGFPSKMIRKQNDDDSEELPPMPPLPPKKNAEKEISDQFSYAIREAIKYEVNTEVVAAIRSRPCFARLWADEKGKICPYPLLDQYDDNYCDLGEQCEATWNLVMSGSFGPQGIPEKQKRKRGRPPKIKGGFLNILGTRERVKKNFRVPYQNAGRPIDFIADMIWEHVGSPPSLPTNWLYPSVENKSMIERARLDFIEQYNDQLWVIKRMSYHQYIYDGLHMMRLWVQSANGGWLDTNEKLTKLLQATNKVELYEIPQSGKKSKHKFYKKRTYVNRQIELEHIKDALTKYLQLNKEKKKDQE
jgi:hypothetical protein